MSERFTPIYTGTGEERQIAQRTEFTDELKTTFCELLSRTGTRAATARMVGIHPSTVTQHVKKDPAFADAVDMALDLYKDRLSEEIDRRGREGYDEPVFYKGEQVGTIRRYSDNLLLAQARRHMPEYRDKGEVNVQVNQGVFALPAPTNIQEDPSEWAERFNGQTDNGTNTESDDTGAD